MEENKEIIEQDNVIDINDKRARLVVRDNEYTIQRLPTKQALDIRSKWIRADWDDLTVGEDILKYWVIEPEQITINDFPVIPELMELVALVMAYQYGEKKTVVKTMQTQQENWKKQKEEDKNWKI